MTKAKPLPDIARCACGKRASAQVIGENEWWVVCDDPFCWTGPKRKTKRGAMLAWNRVMRARRDAQIQLCSCLLAMNRKGGIDAMLNEIDKVVRRGE